MRTNTTPTSNPSTTTHDAGVSPAPRSLQRTDCKNKTLTNSLSFEEVTELLAQALSESFGAIKFSVKVRKSAHCGSLDVAWSDGPTQVQVDAVAKLFIGGVLDTQSWVPRFSPYTFDAQQVTFKTTFLNYYRAITDATVPLAIERVYRRRQVDFVRLGLAKPRAAQYGQCELDDVFLNDASHHAGRSLESELDDELCRLSCGEVTESATLARFAPNGNVAAALIGDNESAS